MSGAQLVLWRPAALWLRGCASSISLLCTFYALSQPQISTSEVLTLTNTFPIWVALLSWPLLRMRPTLSSWVAALCGVAGVALIQSPHYQGSSGATLAIALSMTAALTNAIAMLGLHRIKGVHSWAIVVHYSGVATVFVLGAFVFGSVVSFLADQLPMLEPLGALVDPQLPSLAPLAQTETILLLLGVGVAATLGQVCVTRAFTSGHPTRVSVVGLTQVLFALGLDVLISGATIEVITLCGIVLVLAPTAWMMAGKSAQVEPSGRSALEPERQGDAEREATPAKGGCAAVEKAGC
jgi:drug/metabolite transporter (DMT)-like permease